MQRFLIFILFTFTAFPILHAQENPSGEGGFGSLFKKLKNVVEDVSPPSDKQTDEEKSWLKRAREIGNSTVEKGKQNFDKLITDGTEANQQMQALLAWLDQKLAGREPSFTNEEIQAFAVELIPLVEELNGKKFNAPPEVAITGNFEMIQILGSDLIPQFEKQFPDTPKSLIYLKSYITAGLFAPALMGKYGESVILQFSGPNRKAGSSIEAVVMKFTDESGAKTMVDAMEQLNTHDIGTAKNSALVDVVSEKKISYDAGGGAIGSALRYQIKSPIIGEETTSVIQVQQDNLVAQIIYSDVDLKKRPVDAFLLSVLSKIR